MTMDDNRQVQDSSGKPLRAARLPLMNSLTNRSDGRIACKRRTAHYTDKNPNERGEFTGLCTVIGCVSSYSILNVVTQSTKC
jgi:hypothetical protein